MPAEMLIPQRQPLRLVDRLLEFNGQSGLLESLVLPDNVLVGDDGSLDQLAMVELMAQSYAAVRGYEDLSQGKPVKKGYLVGVRKIQFKGRSFQGDRLHISVTASAAIGEFVVVQGEVFREGELIASGSLKLWIPEHGR